MYKIKLNLISNLKLMQKFLLSYFALIIIPLALLSAFSYTTISNIIKNNATYSSKQAFKQAVIFLNYKLYNIAKISQIIATDSSVNMLITKSAGIYDLHQQLGDYSIVRKFITSFQDNEDIYKVRLYVNDGLVFSNENVNLFNLKLVEKSKWLTLFKQLEQKTLWCPSTYLNDNEPEGEKVLSLVCAIRDLNNYERSIGFLRIDFRKQQIKDIIVNGNSSRGSLTYIYNSHGDVVLCSNEKLMKLYKLDASSINLLIKNKTYWDEKSINSQLCYIQAKTIENSDWTLITVLPSSSILAEGKSIRNLLILISIAISLISYALAFYFSKSINLRIKKIIKGMMEVNSGNLNAHIVSTNKDEIGDLIDNFNFMIKKMLILIDDKFKSGKEVKNLELKALQAQINPHFLYNTMDMINWMALSNMNNEISDAVIALANFYKLSLSKGKDIIFIKDELSHVSLYVQIQNMRYSNKLKFIISIEDYLLNYKINKITLQPIVENSILHGILGKGDVEGTITITGKIEDDDLILSVMDNGIGMKPELLAKMLSDETESSKGSGYGLKNINQRLKLSYGDKYGLTYSSEYGSGTRVDIRLPAIK